MVEIFISVIAVVTIAFLIVSIYEALITRAVNGNEAFLVFIILIYTSLWMTVALKLISLLQEK